MRPTSDALFKIAIRRALKQYHSPTLFDVILIWRDIIDEKLTSQKNI